MKPWAILASSSLLFAARPALADDPPAEVTVAGTPVARTAGSAHVIGEEQLSRYEYDDPTAVVTTVPGVYARGEDGFGLRPNIGIRGVNPDRSKKVALLEDGIPFAPAPYSASAAYFFPMMTRMTAVRVIKGPAAISYGPQTVGGAIDLVTRPIPTTLSGAADVAYGSYGYGKAHVHAGSSDEKVGFLVEGVHLRSDGFKELPNGASDTGFVHNEWMVKGAWVLDPRARTRDEIRVKGTYSDEVSNETYLGLTDQDLRATPDRRYAASALDRMKWFHTSLAITHVHEESRDLSVTTTVYRNDLSRTWRKMNGFRGADVFEVLRDPTTPRHAVYASILRGESDGTTAGEAIRVGPNQREFVSQGIVSRLEFTPRTGPLAHSIEYGVRVHEDRAERRHSEDAFVLAGGALVPEGTPTVVTLFNEATTLAFAMHAIDAITWDRLTVTPGVRIEAMQQRFVDRATNQRHAQTTRVVLPGVGAFYSLTRDLGALAGMYRGFGPPVPALGPVGGGSRVEPELSVNYEAGLRYSRRRLRAEVIGFYNDYSNLTDVCTQSSGCIDTTLDRQFDAGRARIFGLEAFAEHRLPVVARLDLPLRASYTYTETAFLQSFQSDDPIFGNVTRGDQIPYVPRHELNVSVGIEHPRFGINGTMTHVAKTRELASSGSIDETLHTDAQTTFDATGYVRICDDVQLYVNGRNLADARYIVSRRPFGARPNPPRMVQVGLKVTF